MNEGVTGKQSNVGLVDWLMLVLALFSVGLLVYAMIGELSRQTLYTIFLIDTVICGLFAVEFVTRWLQDDRPGSFPFRRWYEILGMIPVAHPALRGFRLLRIVRIVMLLSRFGRAADRAFGADFTYRLTRRFRAAIADAISDAVTLRMFDEVEDLIEQGNFTPNLASALEDHRREVHGLVHDRIKRDPTVGRLRHLPFFDDLVESISVVTQRTLIELLRDPRTERLGKAAIRENLDQLRTTLQEPDAEAGARAKGS
jgi:hypothetical protein